MGAMFESICILKQSQSMRALRGLKSGLTLISEDSALVIFYSQVHLMHIFFYPLEFADLRRVSSRVGEVTLKM